jgi:hypothetical protein
VKNYQDFERYRFWSRRSRVQRVIWEIRKSSSSEVKKKRMKVQAEPYMKGFAFWFEGF